MTNSRLLYQRIVQLPFLEKFFLLLLNTYLIGWICAWYQHMTDPEVLVYGDGSLFDYVYQRLTKRSLDVLGIRYRNPKKISFMFGKHEYVEFHSFPLPIFIEGPESMKLFELDPSPVPIQDRLLDVRVGKDGRIMCYFSSGKWSRCQKLIVVTPHDLEIFSKLGDHKLTHAVVTRSEFRDQETDDGLILGRSIDVGVDGKVKEVCVDVAEDMVSTSKLYRIVNLPENVEEGDVISVLFGKFVPLSSSIKVIDPSVIPPTWALGCELLHMASVASNR